MISYRKFLKQKEIIDIASGFKPTKLINKKLYSFQKKIVEWALIRGRSAIFADCGLGKTPIQLEWANHICKKEKAPILIIAPLAVSKQTRQEGDKFNIQVKVCKNQDDIVNGINITNYEKLHNFKSDKFIGVVLDESSILKSFAGKIKNQIIDYFINTPYKLCCTATPSPNDFMELGNHSEFLGVMKRSEMLSMFFINDTANTGTWRLKKHAESEFWKWMSSWSIYIKKPSDLDFKDDQFIIPKLNIHKIILPITTKPLKGFFHEQARTLNEQRRIRKESLINRIKKIKQIVTNEGAWLIWCNFNNESSQITKELKATEIHGSHKDEYKEEKMIGFSKGTERILVTKPKIAGFGMNWQHCNKVIFAGLSHSYEQYYQAIRRCWRFGQTKTVDIYIIIDERELLILDNVMRKEEDAERMANEMLFYMKDLCKKEIKGISKNTIIYDAQTNMRLPKWI